MLRNNIIPASEYNMTKTAADNTYLNRRELVVGVETAEGTERRTGGEGERGRVGEEERELAGGRTGI